VFPGRDAGGGGVRMKRTEGKPFENEAAEETTLPTNNEGGNKSERRAASDRRGERQRPMDTETRHFKYCGRVPVKEKKRWGGGGGGQDANRYLLAANTLLSLLQSV
jgi:hypothetical protein